MQIALLGFSCQSSHLLTCGINVFLSLLVQALMLTTTRPVGYWAAEGQLFHRLLSVLMKSPNMDGSSVIESPQAEEEAELLCSCFCGDVSVMSPDQDLSDVNCKEFGQNLAKAPHQKAPREPGSYNNSLCVAVEFSSQFSTTAW